MQNTNLFASYLGNSYAQHILKRTVFRSARTNTLLLGYVQAQVFRARMKNEFTRFNPVSYTHLDVYKRQFQIMFDVEIKYCLQTSYSGHNFT